MCYPAPPVVEYGTAPWLAEVGFDKARTMPGRISGSAMIPFRWLGAFRCLWLCPRGRAHLQPIRQKCETVCPTASRVGSADDRPASVAAERRRPRQDRGLRRIADGPAMGHRRVPVEGDPPPSAAARHPNVARDAAAAATDDRNALPLRPPVTSAPQCRREARDGTLGRFPGDEPTAPWRSRARRRPPTGRSTALVRLAQQGQVTPAHGIIPSHGQMAEAAPGRSGFTARR